MLTSCFTSWRRRSTKRRVRMTSPWLHLTSSRSWFDQLPCDWEVWSFKDSHERCYSEWRSKLRVGIRATQVQREVGTSRKALTEPLPRPARHAAPVPDLCSQGDADEACSFSTDMSYSLWQRFSLQNPVRFDTFDSLSLPIPSSFALPLVRRF